MIAKCYVIYYSVKQEGNSWGVVNSAGEWLHGGTIGSKQVAELQCDHDNVSANLPANYFVKKVKRAA